MNTRPTPRDDARQRVPAEDPRLRPMLVFAAVALPTGWLLLSAYQVLGLPDAPFVLLTLLLGLALPAAVLVRRDPAADGRRLVRDAVTMPRRPWLILPALVCIPGLTWAGAATVGGEKALDAGLLGGVGVTLLSSLLIINLLEELVWTGFFQRRAMARWGTVTGSLVTAALFAGIHLPLAFDGADEGAEVLVNVGVLAAAGVGLRLLVAGVDSLSGGSLLTVAVVHASFNAAADVVEADSNWIRYVVTIILGLAAVRHRRPTSRPAPDAQRTDEGAVR